ncbi:MAG TPA: sn-glycerol-3-phosphate ABC transporter ATP-binding protein UgpC [Kofleriaceae bacterium]
MSDPASAERAATAQPAPTAIALRGIAKRFGGTRVLEGIDLEVKQGEFCVFVGPSGCGKSTLLRLIAGLESASAGDLYLDGVRVNDVAPSRRGIAMVFQSYALYPHMTVYENLEFGLSLGKLDKAEADRRIREAARMLQIDHLLDRLPKQLSGGQRQRVAIGRALTRRPHIFLFDEPLSNLDAALRVTMRAELSRLHRQLAATMVYVTHDQVEAMTLADRLVVLTAGRVEQVGAPLEVYHRPRTRFAAGFLGSPRMNFIGGEVTEIAAGGVTVQLTGGGTVTAAVTGDGVNLGDKVTVGIRPEHLRITAAGGAPLSAAILLVENLGDHAILHLDREQQDGGRILAKVDKPPAGEGKTVGFEIPAEDCHVFDAQGLALARRT